jgi:hypothetical protein
MVNTLQEISEKLCIVTHASLQDMLQGTALMEQRMNIKSAKSGQQGSKTIY